MIIKQIISKDGKLVNLIQEKDEIRIAIYDVVQVCNRMEYSIHDKFPRTYAEVEKVYLQTKSIATEHYLDTILEGLILINKISKGFDTKVII